MNQEVREAVIKRAGGVCECGCGKPIPPGELDHFFGRAKAPETVENCWMLHLDCHQNGKTANKPDAATWFRKFIDHCDRHDYREARNRAQLRLLTIEYKTGFKPITRGGYRG